MGRKSVYMKTGYYYARRRGKWRMVLVIRNAVLDGTTRKKSIKYFDKYIRLK